MCNAEGSLNVIEFIPFLVDLLPSAPSHVVIPVLLDVLKRFMENDAIIIQVLITLASYGRIGEQQFK